MNDQPATVDGALANAKALGLDRLDAQLLLAHVLRRPRAWLLAHSDAALASIEGDAFRALLARRIGGEPVAYLIGTQGFHGLTLEVDAGVLVPRPDTELLVDWAIEKLPPDEPMRVLDLGTGSGAVALAVKHARPQAVVAATDFSEAALAVAQRNAVRLGLEIALHRGTWWGALEPAACFELILSNPPYIAGDDPHLTALQHEPALALTPGGDGLGALREIIAGAPAYLAPGGWLLLEHGYDQPEAVEALLCDAGFSGIETRRDLGGRARCTGGRR